MYAIWTLAMKDLRLLVRDRISLFWVLGFPLLLALFFGSIFGGSGDGGRSAISVVVVDDSGGEAEAFIDRLEASEGLELDTVATLEDARDLVRRGKRIAFLHVREGFTDGGFAMFGASSDETPRLGLGVDPTRTAERGLLAGLVTQALFSGMAEQISDPTKMFAQTQQAREELQSATNIDPAQRRTVVALMDALDQFSASSDATAQAQALNDESASASPAFGEGLLEAVDIDRDRKGKPRSPYEITFPSSIVWGLMGCATAFATTLVRERQAGTLLRLRVSPLSRVHVLAGKGLACMIAGLSASTILLTIGMVALGVKIGNPALLVVALLAASACFTGLMMALSMIGKTEAAVSGGSWMLMMPLAMIGGGMIPLIAMPSWMLTASDFSPFKWAIYAIEGAVWRDFSAAELLPALLILGSVAVVLFGIGVVVMRRREE